MESSDEYEYMPEDFQRIVPKTHNKLNELICFYKELR